jgi:carbon monoxide dehydrogenase subunit G
MIRVERTIHIDVPPADAWAVVADLDRWPEWTPTFKRIERHTSEPLGPGGGARLRLKA